MELELEAAKDTVAKLEAQLTAAKRKAEDLERKRKATPGPETIEAADDNTSGLFCYFVGGTWRTWPTTLATRRTRPSTRRPSRSGRQPGTPPGTTRPRATTTKAGRPRTCSPTHSLAAHPRTRPLHLLLYCPRPCLVWQVGVAQDEQLLLPAGDHARPALPARVPVDP